MIGDGGGNGISGEPKYVDEPSVPTLPLVCNRTGAVLTSETRLNAQYWRRHSRQPVQFSESVRTMAALGCSVLMEIGPQPVLTAAAVQIWPEHSAAPRAIVSLRKGVDPRRQIAEALAAAYVSGHRPEFAALHHPQHHLPRRRLELPTYPFQRRDFWPKASGTAVDGAPASGILGSAKDLASGDAVYTSRLSVKSQPWLSDHVIYGTVVVPGATYAAMALAGAVWLAGRLFSGGTRTLATLGLDNIVIRELVRESLSNYGKKTGAPMSRR